MSVTTVLLVKLKSKNINNVVVFVLKIMYCIEFGDTLLRANLHLYTYA